MKKLLTKTKKAILFSTASFCTLVAATSAYQVNDNQNEAAYLIQGASQATMTSLVKQVGGDVVHNFDVIPAISAELTEKQVNELNKINPLLRVTTEAKSAETAGILWGKGAGTGNKGGQKGGKLAGILWGKGAGTGNKGGQIAGILWGKGAGTGNKGGQKGGKLAGILWGKGAGTGNKGGQIAGILWGKGAGTGNKGGQIG